MTQPIVEPPPTSRGPLTVVWDWLKRSWQWIALGVTLLGAGLLAVLKAKPQIPPGPSELDEEKKRIEDHAREEEHAAQMERDNRISAIEEKHAEVIQKLNDEQQHQYEVLKDDPEALNDWLLDVGKHLREP